MVRWVIFVVSLVVLLVPGWVLAQGVGYETFTPVGAGYLYIGLGIQDTFRTHRSMQAIVPAIIICCVLYLLVKRMMSVQPEPLINVVMYGITTAMICAMFWPETVGGLFPSLNWPVYPNAITALTARTGGYTNIDNAEKVLQTTSSVGLIPGDPLAVPGNILTSGQASVTPAFHLLLSSAVGTPISVALIMNDKAGRVYDRTMAFQGLMSVELSSELQLFFDREFMNCYEWAIANVEAQDRLGRDRLDWKTLLPWESVIQTEFAASEVIIYTPDVRTYTWLKNPSPPYINCDDVWTNLRTEVGNELGRVTAGGDPRDQAIARATGLVSDSQVDSLLLRELKRKMGSNVRSAAFERLFKAGVIAKDSSAVLSGRWWGTAATGAGVGAAAGTFVLPGVGTTVGTVVGGIAGALAGLLMDVAKVEIDHFINLIRPLIAILFFMPHIVGVISAVTIGFFPVIVLWSLFPGQHFKPLINYVLVLFFVQSPPLWYAISDMASTYAFNSMDTMSSTAGAERVVSFMGAEMAGMFVTIITVILVPMIQGIIMFGAWRAISGSMKGV